MLSESEIRAKGVELVAKNRGKLEVISKIHVSNLEELSIAYTPGVAEPTMQVYEDKSLQYEYTAKKSLVAIVTDGTAVLGFGDIGPEAAMVVMEGKGVMLKCFANVDPVPLCLNIKDQDAIVDLVKAIEPSFGFIFLEDISAPRCFYIEERLSKELSIPVFHDDQHGTAIATCAALMNIARLTKENLFSKRVVLNGPGAAGIATYKLMSSMGFNNIVICNSKGVVANHRDDLPDYLKEIAKNTKVNPNDRTLEDVLKGADIFIGLSRANLVTQDMVRSMNPNPIVFAMANPSPEIMPPLALEAGARFVGTGRYDFPNTINNVLAFPGIVRGALDAKATKITVKMKLAAAEAIALCVPDKELAEDNLLPNPLDSGVADCVAKYVAKMAIEENVVRKD